MAPQYLQCEVITLRCFTPASPVICPGAVVVCVASVVVKLPRVEYPTVVYALVPQQFILLNTIVQLPDFRGPPLGTPQDYSSDTHSLLIADLSARSVYAA